MDEGGLGKALISPPPDERAVCCPTLHSYSSTLRSTLQVGVAIGEANIHYDYLRFSLYSTSYRKMMSNPTLSLFARACSEVSAQIISVSSALLCKIKSTSIACGDDSSLGFCCPQLADTWHGSQQPYCTTLIIHPPYSFSSTSSANFSEIRPVVAD